MTQDISILLVNAILMSLPSIVSLFLSIFNFTFSILIRSIELKSQQCPSYNTQMIRPREVRFPCIRDGSNVISITSAVTSLSITILINSHLSTKAIFRNIGFISGLLLFSGVFAYVIDYNKEKFKLGIYLIQSHYKILQFLGNHTAILANISSVILSIIYFFIVMY